MKTTRSLVAGLIVTACAIGWLAPATVQAGTFGSVNDGAGYSQALLDIITTIACNQQNQGHYYDLSNQQQIVNDVLNASLSALGPLGLTLELSHDATNFLSSAAIGTYLNSGGTSLEAEMAKYEGNNNESSLPPSQLTDFMNYVQTIDFTTSQGASLADAALASYGSLVAGVPPDQIGQFVADNRGNVNSNSQMLSTGLTIMMMRELQGSPADWNNADLTQFMLTALGDKYGLVNLGNWIYQQILNLQCPPPPPTINPSLDPNAISVQPGGAGSGHWVPATRPLTYTIQFENEPTALAAALNIRVALSLDASLDPNTVQEGPSSFAGALFAFDPQSGQLTWTLPNINLPPDSSPPNGEGWVSFTATPKSGLANGTTINESANVYFDYNPPVQTNQLTSTVDATPPVVTLAAVPAHVSSTPLTLSWSTNSAAGVQGYAVYLSTNGGAFSVAATTTGTSLALPVVAGYDYGVTVVATDVAGLASGAQPPTSAQASFTAVSSGTSSGGGGGGGGAAGPPSGSTAGQAGGILASSDGSFTMTVPAGDIGQGQALSVSTSSTAPSGAPSLPAAFTTASPYITLTGATLSQPVVATIKYQAAAGQTVNVFADGAWHYVPTTVGANGTVQVYVTGPDTLVVVASSVQFSDVPSGYWAAGNIQTLVAADVVNGFPDGTFQPDGTLTRAQFVKMLDLTLNLATNGTATRFADVSASDWFAPYVAAAVQAGLVQGTSATTFSPNDAVTREQMGVLLVRALKLTKMATLGFKDDARIDAWATAGVEQAVAAGYLNGFPDGTFQPLGPTTRAQAAKVLALAIAHMAPKAS